MRVKHTKDTPYRARNASPTKCSSVWRPFGTCGPTTTSFPRVHVAKMRSRSTTNPIARPMGELRPGRATRVSAHLAYRETTGVPPEAGHSLATGTRDESQL